MDAIYELKELLCDELEEYGKKDKLDVGGLEIVDKLAHTIKNLDKIIENYDEGYSGTVDGNYRVYDRGGSYDDRGRSYARGRGRRRDSMGRYSRDKEMIRELRELMEDAPDEKTRMEFQKFISKIENMA